MRTSMVLSVALILSGCGSDAPDDELKPVRAQDIPRVVSGQEALDTSAISTLDPHTMNDAEINKVLGQGPFCAFRYVSDGKPVLAWKPQPEESSSAAVVKLNGVLVGLHNTVIDGSNHFVADSIRLTLMAADANQTEAWRAEHPRESKLLFEIEQQLRVGYGGYSVCST